MILTRLGGNGLDPYAARPGSKWEPRRADGLPNIPGIAMPAELEKNCNRSFRDYNGN